RFLAHSLLTIAGPSTRSPERQNPALKTRERAEARSLSFAPSVGAFLLAEAARDVAEDVLDLVAENDQDYDDNHRDQDEDEGVINHTLAFLTVEQGAEAEIQIAQHARFTSFSNQIESNGPSFTSGRVQINAGSAKRWRKSFDDSVTLSSSLTTSVTGRLALVERNLDLDFRAAAGLAANLQR